SLSRAIGPAPERHVDPVGQVMAEHGAAAHCFLPTFGFSYPPCLKPRNRFHMDFIKGLIEKVKPELNHIYTEKPFLTAEGRDFGWFCREHALHLYGVATLLGKNAEICVGDVLLRRPQGDPFHSIGVPRGHGWCCLDGLDPVDVSLTVKDIYPDLPDIKLIYGARLDLSAPFHLRYLVNEPDEVFRRLGETDDLLIGYNEKNRYHFDLLELLAHPFQFLYKPPPEMR